MILISYEGERHEYRIPLKIVQTYKEAIALLTEAARGFPISQRDVETEYDEHAKELTIFEDETFEEELAYFLIEKIDKKIEV